MINKIVRDTVKEFVKDKKSFTSVDISNSVKNKGTWISNTDVSHQMKELFLKNYKRYSNSLVPLTSDDGETVQAILYYPKKLDLSTYSHPFSTAIKPDQTIKNSVSRKQTKNTNKSIQLDNKDRDKKNINSHHSNRDYSSFNFVS